MRKLKKFIEVYLPQVVLIVFSVVLGLYLNQKMVERNDRIKANQLLLMVKAEIKSNQKILENWYPYHKQIYQELDSLKNDPEFIKEFQEDKDVLKKSWTRRTFMGEIMSDASWEVAKLNPVVSEISFDKMNFLTKLYLQQSLTFTPMLDMFEIFNQPFINTPKNAKENLNLINGYMKELVARESELAYYFEAAKEML